MYELNMLNVQMIGYLLGLDVVLKSLSFHSFATKIASLGSSRSYMLRWFGHEKTLMNQTGMSEAQSEQTVITDGPFKLLLK